MLEVGCCSFNFRGLSLEDSLSLTSGMGFQKIGIGAFSEDSQVHPSDILSNPKGTGKRVRDACKRYGLIPIEFFVCDIPLPDGAKAAPNEPNKVVRDNMFSSFRKICECAAEAGFSHIMTVPGRPDPESLSDSGMSISIESLSKMVSIANDFSVDLTIEPHAGSLVSTPETLRFLLDNVKELRLTLDHSHFIGAGIRPEEWFSFHSDAVYIHAKPSKLGVPKCLFYDAEDYYEPIIKDLLDKAWEGVIAVECMYPVKAPDLESHPAFQTALLAGQLDRKIRKLQHQNHL